MDLSKLDLKVPKLEPGAKVEIEARFGTFESNPKGGKQFSSSLGLVDFNLILNKYQAIALRTEFTDESMDVKVPKAGYKREKIRRRQYSPSGEVEWLKKSSYSQLDDPSRGVRVAVSVEKPLTEADLKTFHFTPTYRSEKTRYSIRFGDPNQPEDIPEEEVIYLYLLELTVAKDSTGRTAYEAELELLDNTLLAEFPSMIDQILAEILDSDLIYTSAERINVIREINHILSRGTREGLKLTNKYLSQARNLNYEDLVYGGVLGNAETSYTITHKSDGDRKELYFGKEGVYLFYPPRYLNKIAEPFIEPAKWNSTLVGTILEGEVIPAANRLSGAPDDSLEWYIIYDCIAQTGSNAVQESPHVNRLEYARKVMTLLRKMNSRYQFDTKEFRSLHKSVPPALIEEQVDHFYSVIRSMYAEQALGLPYKTDGFIFTPSGRYNPWAGKITPPLKDRALTTDPDLCKLKPPEQMTIDFRVKRNAQGEIELYSRGKGQDVLFLGSPYHPWTRQRVDSLAPLTLNVEDGSIVEYKYDVEANKMVPERLRTNKTKPNTLEIAQANWNWLHDPITEATISGETLRLVIKHHSRLKRKLYKQILREAHGRPMKLIEIGAGQGGDSASWKGFDKVLAVEPGKKYLDELYRRIEGQGLSESVRVVNTGGENTEVIEDEMMNFFGEPADVLALMLSASFFWKNEEMIMQLAATISNCVKRGGQVYFLTIDGPAVEDLFSTRLTSYEEPGDVTIELNGGFFTRTFGEDLEKPELLVKLPGTKMVSYEQTEWMVYIEDLLRYLSGATLDHFVRTDTEWLLSPNERIYARLYAWGVITLPTNLESTTLDSARDLPIPPLQKSEIQLSNVRQPARPSPRRSSRVAQEEKPNIRQPARPSPRRSPRGEEEKPNVRQPARPSPRPSPRRSPRGEEEKPNVRQPARPSPRRSPQGVEEEKPNVRQPARPSPGRSPRASPPPAVEETPKTRENVTPKKPPPRTIIRTVARPKGR